MKCGDNIIATFTVLIFIILSLILAHVHVTHTNIYRINRLRLRNPQMCEGSCNTTEQMKLYYGRGRI